METQYFRGIGTEFCNTTQKVYRLQRVHEGHSYEVNSSTAPAGKILNLTDLAAKARQLLYTWRQLAESGQQANHEKSREEKINDNLIMDSELP